VSLSEQASERTISGVIDIRLIPSDAGIQLGHTDAAREIGVGLIREAARLLVAAAEREGFRVELEYRQVVY